MAGLMRGAISTSILRCDVLRIPIPLIVVFDILFYGSAVGAFICCGLVSLCFPLFRALGRRVYFTGVVAGVYCVGMQCFTRGLRQAGGGNRAVGRRLGLTALLLTVAISAVPLEPLGVGASPNTVTFLACAYSRVVADRVWA